MSKRYGALRFLGYGMLLNSVFAFFVPVAARQGGVIWLSIVRFIQGLGEGPIVPCTHAMLAKWIPPTERSRMGAFVYAGKFLTQKTYFKRKLKKIFCLYRCSIRYNCFNAVVWSFS